MFFRRMFVAAVAVAIVMAGSRMFAQAPPALNPDLYKGLKFRYIGPVGNRIISIVGVPGAPNVYYAGAASGGIFKTTDDGAHWDASFDDQPVSSIGSLAIAPSDPNVVWAGTGESFIRSNVSIGNGIYKSTDAGKTWTHAGLDKTGRIARIVIDPGMTATGRGQDQLRMPSEMFEKLSHLADVVSLNDFPPTDQALEVHETFTKEINGYRDQMARVVGSDVAAINNVLPDRKVGGGIVVVK
jgi:hypothetical protein